jgi:hypothetical protein
LISQDSRKACTKGRTGGERRGGIWVSEGCRGTFLATHGNRNPSRSFGMRGHPNIPANVTRSGGYVVETVVMLTPAPETRLVTAGDIYVALHPLAPRAPR